MKEYQAVRQAEKRGSQTADYYLALPYHDLSGHNQQQWAIRGRTYAYLEKKILPDLKASASKGLRVLDLGAGNGWMSYRLALLGHEPVAVDLLTSDMDGLGAAVHYQGVLKNLFPRFQAELDHLPFVENQFDVAVFNASFHYSENYRETLREVVRCLRPRGKVIIADTPWYSRDESGRTMVRERQAYFTKLYGFPSDGIASMEYLTDERLDELASGFGLKWQIFTPFYGVGWAMRPFIAKLKNKREPSRFRIYVAEVAK
jgi:SAM-dependent methyltransferase